MAQRYVFTRLTADDMPLIRQWMARRHVAEWWPDDGEEIAEVVSACARDRMEREGATVPYLVALDGLPFAYLQCTREAERVHSIDQFIGEAELLGRGHGSAFVRQFCDALFADGVPSVTTDPDPTNHRAVRAYEKAGFRPIGPRDTAWGHVLLMQRDKS